MKADSRRSLLAVIALLLLLPVATRAEPAAEREAETEHRWFRIHFQDQPAGWVHEVTRRDGERITSEAITHLAIKRGRATIEVETTMRFVETADGEPIEMATTQKLPGQESRKHVRFTDDGHIVTITQGGREHREKRPPFEDDWLPPAAASRYIERQLERGAETIRFRTLDPTIQLRPFEATLEVLGSERIELPSGEVEAIKRRVTMSNLPGVSPIEYVDEDGRMLKTTFTFGTFRMEMVAVDRALAQGKIEAPEILLDSLVNPDFSLVRPRELRRAAFRLSVDDGRFPDLPETAVQRVERVDESTAIVRIDLDRPGDEPAEAKTEAPGIRHTPMIDGEDPRIVDLAERAAGEAEGDDPAARAEAMRRFVHGYMREVNLTVAMASASEVARQRRGDCTEHAVLLAALLKADGTPARVASGLIYARRFAGQRDVFGYHMWTQAWLDGRWVDLDPTLPPETPFDATHITLSTSHLDDGHQVEDMNTLIPLLGRLSIEMAEE